MIASGPSAVSSTPGKAAHTGYCLVTPKITGYKCIMPISTWSLCKVREVRCLLSNNLTDVECWGNHHHPRFPKHVLDGISKLPKMSGFRLFFPIDMLSTVLIHYVHLHCFDYSLKIPPFSHTTIGRLCTTPAWYWTFHS